MTHTFETQSRVYEVATLPDGRRVQRETSRSGRVDYYAASMSGDDFRKVQRGNESLRERIDAAIVLANPGPHCEVCGANTRHDAGRCTNSRCSSCHATYCTPGGVTSPGHGRGTVPTRFAKETTDANS